MNRPTGNLSLHCSSPVHLQWQVPEFFTVPSDTTRIFISPCFLFVHTQWRIALVTSGTDSRLHSGWVGMRLLWDGSTTTTRHYRITLNMGINRPDGTEFRSWNGVGNPNNRDWGPEELVLRTELLDDEDMTDPDGILRVFCILTAEKIGAVKDTSRDGSMANVKAQIQSGVEKLQLNLKDLMVSGEESDISLMVKDREFKSHRPILAARSPVFAAMLRHNMIEKDSGFVKVEDCDPDAFQLFMEHLYTGNIQELSEDTVFAVYKIADKYDAPDLKARCLYFVLDCISVETFCDVVTLASQYEEWKLLEKAITFFSKNMRQVVATAKWQEFLKDYTEVGNELLVKALDRMSGNEEK